jgi:hypothetical protein
MKYLFPFLLILVSFNGHAGDKCYSSSRKAAINFAIKEEYISDASQFTSGFGDEVSKIIEYNGIWQKELHSFSNTSLGIDVEVDYIQGKCFIKKTTMFQNDQDEN